MEIWPKANAAERIDSVHSFFTSVLPEVSLLDSVHQIVIHLVSVRPQKYQSDGVGSPNLANSGLCLSEISK